eukprot:29742-Pelagococcus_subviridis.AAC.3
MRVIAHTKRRRGGVERRQTWRELMKGVRAERNERTRVAGRKVKLLTRLVRGEVREKVEVRRRQGVAQQPPRHVLRRLRRADERLRERHQRDALRAVDAVFRDERIEREMLAHRRVERLERLVVEGFPERVRDRGIPLRAREPPKPLAVVDLFRARVDRRVRARVVDRARFREAEAPERGDDDARRGRRRRVWCAASDRRRRKPIRGAFERRRGVARADVAQGLAQPRLVDRDLPRARGIERAHDVARGLRRADDAAKAERVVADGGGGDSSVRT